MPVKIMAVLLRHVYKTKRETIDESSENEDDMLDKVWGLAIPDSVAKLKLRGDLVIEIPKYTINMVSENH